MLGRPRPLRLLIVGAILASLAGCGGITTVQDSGPDHPVDVSQVKDAVPRYEPRSRYGNPPSYVVNGHRYFVRSSAKGYVATGTASWYGTKFHGQRTSSGEPYDMYAMTAAHRTLPLPTYARVTNLENGRSVVVKVNDRGPFHSDRILDLSYAAASKLGMLGKGTARVRVEAITPGEPAVRPAPLQAVGEPKPLPPPVSQAATTPTPAAASKPAPAGGGYFLQVGAFSSRSNAEKLRTRLAPLAGEPVTIEPVNNQQATLYRVRIGPVPSAEEADRLAGRLTKEGVATAQIIPD